jgi:lantibiotic biosynthesis dehydratase-like protein
VVNLSSTGWTLWRWVCVRGAGFPADGVLALASPDAAAMIDRLLALDDEARDAGARAIEAVARQLDKHVGRDAREARKPIGGYLRKLRAGTVPESVVGLDAEALVAIDALRATSHAARDLRAALATTLGAERLRCVRTLHNVARDPRIREAIRWQNRTALHTGVDALLRQAETASNAKVRNYERLVASYLQRYCVKNETIGFFGPVGWATFDLAGPAIAVQPGTRLLATRTVYFEYWAIEALATAIANDPVLRPALPPRRHPTVWVEGTTIHHPIDRTTEVPLEFARLLEACDGVRSAREIAAQLVADPELELSSEDEVYELLDELASKGLAIWTLELPPHVEDPDRVLSSMLDAVADRDAAHAGRTKLAELTAARDSIARAAGDEAALDVALGAIEQTFTTATGTHETRRAGETYAGRTLVYEDCRRDLAMTIGPAVIERIAAPLQQLLASARWFTYTLARRFRDTFIELFHELVGETGSGTVDFLRFWQRASDHFSGDFRTAPPIVAEVTAELQRRWAGLLGLEGAVFERHRLDVAVADIATRAADMFAAPHPGWPSARHHSPDLMIAARGVDAIARGEFQIVAGELHVACATVATPWTVRQHPHPDEIVATLAAERPPVLEAVVSKERANRADRFSILPADLDLEFGVARSRRDRDHVVETGSLVVELHEERLRVATRDGTRSFELEEVIDSFLSNETAAHFHVLAPVPHCPRIALDGFVIHRESWRFETAHLDFAKTDDPVERMIAVRRWARAHQLPRFLFYKVPQETKPCFVDLDSPHFVELLAHLARAAPALSVSEMLPAIDQVWLPDAQERRHTSELRLVAVDPEPWRTT